MQYEKVCDTKICIFSSTVIQGASVVATEFIHLHGKQIKTSYHPRHALTRWRLLVHVELSGHIVGQSCLILELWAQPCSRQPLASRLAVRTAIGARVGHHIHLEDRASGGNKKMREMGGRRDGMRDREEEQRRIQTTDTQTFKEER